MKTFRAYGILALIAVAAVAVYVYRSGTQSGDPIVSVAPTPLADDTIVLYEPLPGQQGITSPLKVRGKARGAWFFEAVFPVTLTDWDGRVIANTQAQATTNWMTTDFVEFEATLTFEKPAGPGSGANRGFLTLKKDNPSGLPEHDDHREVMIFFAE